MYWYFFSRVWDPVHWHFLASGPWKQILQNIETENLYYWAKINAESSTDFSIFTLIIGPIRIIFGQKWFKECKISQNMVLRIRHSNSTFWEEHFKIKVSSVEQRLHILAFFFLWKAGQGHFWVIFRQNWFAKLQKWQKIALKVLHSSSSFLRGLF